MKKLKELKLREKIWRCGDDAKNEDNRRGYGSTYLLNNEGFMCCLGQFSCQINKKIRKHDLLELGQPFEVCKDIENLTERFQDDVGNTHLSDEAININDDVNTSVKEKVKLLRDLFRSYGYKITFIASKSKKKNN